MSTHHPHKNSSASGVYVSATTGAAELSLSPDELGDADVEIYRDSGDVILSFESSSTDGDSAGCLVVLTDEEANEIGDNLLATADVAEGEAEVSR